METTITELRKYRIDNIALFDLIGSFLIGVLLSWYFNNKKIILLIIPLGIITHIIFGVNSTLNQKLFNKEFNIYKVLVFLNIFLFFYLK
jgi:hypothetical protein